MSDQNLSDYHDELKKNLTAIQESANSAILDAAAAQSTAELAQTTANEAKSGLNGKLNTTTNYIGKLQVNTGTASNVGSNGTLTLKNGTNVTLDQDGNEVTINASQPTVGNGTITISQTGKTNQTFTVNQTGNTTISLNDTTYSAAGTNLGLVKTGGDVTISSGTITVNDNSHNHTWSNITNIPGSFTPISHAVSDTTYGAGSSSNYGHVKLSDSTNSTSSTGSGTAATPSAVKSAYDLAANKARCATLVIAAPNSSAKAKVAADYVCDGTSDQTEINNAISALPTSGGKIVLLEGTYNISDTININKPNVTIEGMGAGTRLARVSEAGSGFTMLRSSAEGFELAHLTVDGQSEMYPIKSGNGIAVNLGGESAKVHDCSIVNYRYGLNVLNEKAAVFDNVLSNLTGVGINTSDSGNHCTVSRNYVCDCGVGIGIQRSYSKVCDNYVIRGTGKTSDYTSSQHTITVSSTNNVISDNYIPGKKYTNSGGSTNVFINNVWDGSNVNLTLSTDLSYEAVS